MLTRQTDLEYNVRVALGTRLDGHLAGTTFLAQMHFPIVLVKGFSLTLLESVFEHEMSSLATCSPIQVLTKFYKYTHTLFCLQLRQVLKIRVLF